MSLPSSPVTEVVTLKLGPKFSEEATKPLVEAVRKQPGCRNIVWGQTTEDTQVAHLFIEWESIGHHMAFGDNTEVSKPIVDGLVEQLTEPLTFFHVPFEPFPPTKVMAGPIIELGQLMVKDEPGALEEAEKIVKKVLGLASQQPKCHGSAMGKSVEDPNKIVIVLAWESVEAHTDEFQRTSEFKEASAPLWKYLKEGGFAHVKVKAA